MTANSCRSQNRLRNPVECPAWIGSCVTGMRHTGGSTTPKDNRPACLIQDRSKVSENMRVQPHRLDPKGLYPQILLLGAADVTAR